MPFNFGSRKYGYGIYGGHDTPYHGNAVPVYIEQYDNTLARKGTFQIGVGGFYNCDFSLDENGCRDFTLSFTKRKNFAVGDLIKIKIFSSIDYFFTGVIRSTPIEGSTKIDYTYTGYGLNDYLHRISAGSQSLGGNTISSILNTLLTTIITVKTPIANNPAKISLPAIIPTTFNTNYNQMIDALDAIKKIANSSGDYYVFGVDSEGDFFFKPKQTDTKATLVVGKKGIYGIPEYNPTDDYIPKTKYYVLDKNGAYVTTVNTTVTDNDVYEEKLTAPDIDNTSLALWAAGIMLENEIGNRRAAIEWNIEPIDPLRLVADGSIRIISNVPPTTITTPTPNPYGSGTYGSGLYGGGQYTGFNLDDTLTVKQVKYEIGESKATRSIDLGNMPVKLDDTMIKIQKELTDLKISLGR